MMNEILKLCVKKYKELKKIQFYPNLCVRTRKQKHNWSKLSMLFG